MKKRLFRAALFGFALAAFPFLIGDRSLAQEPVFGRKFPNLESMATGEWSMLLRKASVSWATFHLCS